MECETVSTSTPRRFMCFSDRLYQVLYGAHLDVPQEFASAVGISYTHAYKILAGQSMPSFPVLQRIINILPSDANLFWLLTGETREPPRARTAQF